MDVKRKVKRCCNCSCHNLHSYFSEYCDNTSIHGMKYFSQKRTKPEIFYWIIIITVSLTFLGYMIYILAVKFVSMPVIVSFTTKETAIFEVPFPTITICSKSKISSHYFNYTSVANKIRNNITLTEKEIEFNNYAVLICDGELRRKSLRNNYYAKLVSEDIYEFFNKSKRDFFHYCYWMGGSIPCEQFFTPIITEEGVCYSLNFLDASELFQDDVYTYSNFFQVDKRSTWNIEQGYTGTVQAFNYPVRAYLTGVSKSLSVVMYSKKSSVDRFCSTDDGGGYLVSIDIPGKLPRLSHTSINVGSNTNVLGAIQPEVMTTSEAVKAYSPAKRDCFFQEEKPLRFFKIYTQSNCLLECFTNITLEKCNCSAIFMPRTNDTPICGLGSYKCLDESEVEFLAIEMLSKQKIDVTKYRQIPDCNCMPLCSDINYNIEISQNPWKDVNILKRKGEEKMYDESNEISDNYELPDFYLEENEEVEFASLTLFMKRNHLETKQRNEVYGFIDFLSGFGGLLGLFTGFSLLSLMEIVYFLTLRIFGNYKKHRCWHGEEEVKTA